MDPALDRAHSDATDPRGILIGQPLSYDQQQRLPVLDRELGQRLEHVLDIALRGLLRGCPKASSEEPVWVLDLAALLPVLAIEAVAQDREQPCLQVRARLEA